MTQSRTRRVVISAILGLVLVAPITPSLSGAAAAPEPAATPASEPTGTGSSSPSPYRLDDGVTTPQYSFADAIRESVWVLAPDLDSNGEPDRVAVDIVRPAELDGTQQIPVIMDASPYYACCGRGNESELKEYDADGNPTKFPLFYDNYFVPRGYAYAAIDMAGTNRSTGCVDEGAASDVLSVKAVVDWLNGRADAVDADGNAVVPDWTNGSSALIGKSYDGTLANGVAATGVEGLETIVPISAISSWYDYTRYQGLPFYYDYATWLSAYVALGRTEPVDCSAVLAAMAATTATRPAPTRTSGRSVTTATLPRRRPPTSRPAC
ncbi:MAG: CocE/NonD family hydrolase [Nocardioidaceae bacterium]